MLKVSHIAGFHSTVVRIHDEPQPGDAVPGRADLGAGMQAQPEHGQAIADCLFPLPQVTCVVAKQRQIVDIP